jgi:UDP-MurNAc hydroxylase
MKPNITLINHASVLIGDGNINLLSDPWFFGGAFNDGWALLYETPKEDIEDILGSISHIWISHEHPDHFSVPFFIKYAEIINKNKIEILFQETKDKRVINFLRSKKMNVSELANKEKYNLSTNITIRCIKSSFYDSALEINIGSKKMLNLNDCPITNPQEIESFRKEFGTYDILLTQFSYAAWKGGKDNIQWRRSAAEEKIDTMKQQSRILGVKQLIPFASFIRFSNPINNYLNDQGNKPADVSIMLKDEDYDVIFLKPMVNHDIDDLKPSDEGINFWEEKFSIIEGAELSKYESVNSEDDLNDSYRIYRSRIFQNNSKALIYLLRMLPLGFFRDIRFKLSDLQKYVDVDITSGDLIFSDVSDNCDIELESASLDFLFKNTFGFDTLTVNGCFEEGKNGGFSKFTKSLAIENLNNLGIAVNLKLILRFDLIILFLKSLRRVSRKLS